jgi:vacuolar-type H+-ATPase subunit H
MVEQNMSAIINEAREFAKQIRADADATARQLPIQARAQAMVESKERVLEAKRLAAELRESVLNGAREEVRRIDEGAQSRIEGAVEYVVSEVIRTVER